MPAFYVLDKVNLKKKNSKRIYVNYGGEIFLF